MLYDYKYVFIVVTAAKLCLYVGLACHITGYGIGVSSATFNSLSVSYLFRLQHNATPGSDYHWRSLRKFGLSCVIPSYIRPVGRITAIVKRPTGHLTSLYGRLPSEVIPPNNGLAYLNAHCWYGQLKPSELYCVIFVVFKSSTTAVLIT